MAHESIFLSLNFFTPTKNKSPEKATQMSHFAVNLILHKKNATKEKIEKLLAPFDENIEMPEYVREDVSEKDKKGFKNYYIEQNKATKKDDFETLYAKFGEEWNGNQWKKINDKWVEISTYNPKSKWDWYRIGGRWAGWLQDREKELETDNGFNFNTPQEIEDNVLPISEAITKNKTPFAVIIPDGQWIERGQMGWWGMAHNEKKGDKWDKEVINIYQKYNHPDYVVVTVDCHI